MSVEAGGADGKETAALAASSAADDVWYTLVRIILWIPLPTKARQNPI